MSKEPADATASVANPFAAPTTGTSWVDTLFSGLGFGAQVGTGVYSSVATTKAQNDPALLMARANIEGDKQRTESRTATYLILGGLALLVVIILLAFRK